MIRETNEMCFAIYEFSDKSIILINNATSITTASAITTPVILPTSVSSYNYIITNCPKKIKEEFKMIFASEKRTITKYQREEIRITEEYIDDTMKWITKRDIDLLMLLLKHPYLTISQVEMILFNDLKPSSWRTKANERVGRLYKANCIDRFFPPTEKDCGSSEQHLILDYAGARVIAKYKGHTGKFRWKKRDYIPQNYRHYLKIMDFKALLHALNRQVGYTNEGTVGEIIRFDTEQMRKFHYNMNNKVHQGKLIPDAFCIYKYTARGDAKFFYLECDNATEPMETIKSKLLNYRRYFASGEWRQEKWARATTGFPAILFLFHKQEQVDEMVAYSRRLDASLRFLFTTYDSLFTDDIKIYVNSLGKKRKVVQKRNVRILDSIWYSKDGLVSF